MIIFATIVLSWRGGIFPQGRDLQTFATQMVVAELLVYVCEIIETLCVCVMVEGADPGGRPLSPAAIKGETQWTR